MIVGYTFQADIYCRDCIIATLPTGPGEKFDGWALAAGVLKPVEENLSEIAYAFRYNRDDENSFDSSEFPKVISKQMAEVDASWGADNRCRWCGTDILDPDYV